jgi:hypothetical protein
MEGERWGAETPTPIYTLALLLGWICKGDISLVSLFLYEDNRPSLHELLEKIPAGTPTG